MTLVDLLVALGVLGGLAWAVSAALVDGLALVLLWAVLVAGLTVAYDHARLDLARLALLIELAFIAWALPFFLHLALFVAAASAVAVVVSVPLASWGVDVDMGLGTLPRRRYRWAVPWLLVLLVGVASDQRARSLVQRDHDVVLPPLGRYRLLVLERRFMLFGWRSEARLYVPGDVVDGLRAHRPGWARAPWRAEGDWLVSRDERRPRRRIALHPPSGAVELRCVADD